MDKISPKSMLDELTIAFKTEIAGHAFYIHAAEVVSDEHGKNVFRHLASEELQHIDVISFISDSLKNGRGWMGYAEALKSGLSVRGTKGLPIFEGKNELIEKLKGNETDENAITVAIESEEKAVEFYGNMLRHAKTPEEKVLLTELLEMEKGHLKLLRWEYESLVGNGFWCDFMEYSVEKEVE